MSRRILVVDDDDALTEMIRMNLEHSGFEVDVAHNGREGLERARKHRPDAMVLDIMMPKMNGYQLCAEVQKDEALRDIPMVVMTALTESETREEEKEWCERLGVADFIAKPFDAADLIERVKAILS